jgi:uncharacterized protein (DUF4415 family)
MPSEKEKFQRDLLESVKQMRSGQAARRTRIDTEKSARNGVAVALHLPADVVERWKATGPGWQQRMTDLLSNTIP